MSTYFGFTNAQWESRSMLEAVTVTHKVDNLGIIVHFIGVPKKLRFTSMLRCCSVSMDLSLHLRLSICAIFQNFYNYYLVFLPLNA